MKFAYFEWNLLDNFSKVVIINGMIAYMGGDMKDFKNLTVRIRWDIYDSIREIAQKEYRSVSSQINLFLEEQIERELEKRNERSIHRTGS